MVIAVGAAQPDAQAWPSKLLDRNLAISFLNDYARDMKAGDRRAICRHYSTAGAYLGRDGRFTFFNFDGLKQRYHGADWRSPADLEWSDIKIVPIGPAAGIVTCRLSFGSSNALYDYLAILTLEDDALKICFEDERKCGPM